MDVRIFETRQEMGVAAGESAAARIRQILNAHNQASIVFASAASQVECLLTLRKASGIDWQRVTAFHMDEYVGMRENHPASFRRFIREHLLDHIPVREFHGIRGDAADAEAECRRYAELLRANPPGFVIMGIGENGHLAFNDPPVAQFDDPKAVKVVELDEICRNQQVHDGAFGSLEEVPRQAITLTMSMLMGIPSAVVVVPGPTKREAVRAALRGPITTDCPASILRTHPDASLFLDRASAELLD